MAYCTSGWMLFVFLLHASMSASPILSKEYGLNNEEQNLLEGLNSYRGIHNLGDLSENRGANCLADKIASQFQDNQACFPLPTQGSYSISAGPGNSIDGYYRLLGDCNLNIANTKDGVILPACVGDINSDITFVVANFTQTSYSQYLRNSDYTGVGIGSEGSWVVVVLATHDEGGDFSSRADATSAGAWMVVVGVFLHLLNWM